MDDWQAIYLTIDLNPTLVTFDLLYPLPCRCTLHPWLLTPYRVYYAVTSPDSLRQLCITVWLMRVISPKQQNDHFGGEPHRRFRLHVSPFSYFVACKKGRWKRYTFSCFCVSPGVSTRIPVEMKKHPRRLSSVALLLLIIIIWCFVLPKALQTQFVLQQ